MDKGMTKEEARIRVKNLISDAKLYDGKAFKLHLADSEIEALEVVIKASEQEPCEITHGSTYGGVSWGGTYKPEQTTDGAVSRQAVKEQMIKYGFRAPDMTVTEFVEDLPPVNPQEPKTGYWIYKTVRGQKVPCCSRCGLDSGISYEFDFCPSCGAKMLPQPYNGESENKE